MQEAAFSECRLVRISEEAGFIMDFQQLQSIRLHSDGLARLCAEFDMCLSHIPPDNIPDAKIVATLFRAHLEASQQLKSTMHYYYIEHTQKGGPHHSYEQLRQIVKNHLDAALLKRNKAGLQNSTESYG